MSGFAYLVHSAQRERARATGRMPHFDEVRDEVAELWKEMDAETKAAFKAKAKGEEKGPSGQPTKAASKNRRRTDASASGPHKGGKAKTRGGGKTGWHTLQDMVDRTHFISYQGAERDFRKKRSKERIQMLEELQWQDVNAVDVGTERHVGLTLVPLEEAAVSDVWAQDKDNGARLTVPAELALFHFSLGTGLLDNSVKVWTVGVEEDADGLAFRRLLQPDSEGRPAPESPWTRLSHDGRTRRFASAAIPGHRVAAELHDLVHATAKLYIAAAEWDRVLGGLQWLKVVLEEQSGRSLVPNLADPMRFRTMEDLAAATAAYVVGGFDPRKVELELEADAAVGPPEGRCRLHPHSDASLPCAATAAARLVAATQGAYRGVQLHGPPPPRPKARRQPSLHTASPEPQLSPDTTTPSSGSSTPFPSLPLFVVDPTSDEDDDLGIPDLVPITRHPQSPYPTTPAPVALEETAPMTLPPAPAPKSRPPLLGLGRGRITPRFL